MTSTTLARRCRPTEEARGELEASRPINVPICPLRSRPQFLETFVDQIRMPGSGISPPWAEFLRARFHIFLTFLGLGHLAPVTLLRAVAD